MTEARLALIHAQAGAPSPGVFALARAGEHLPSDGDVDPEPAAAWDMTCSNDLRIEMRLKLDEEVLITVHQELRNICDFMSHWQKPMQRAAEVQRRLLRGA